MEEPSLQQNEDPIVTELDHDIECPRCNDIMELNSKLDALVYYCENCSFFLKCV
jgi:late competence protein required for DNA uptake (superfamily II DNA/RNA helicase)